MKIPRPGKHLPSWRNLLLSIVAAVLLILAFPDFEYWFLAWFALVPLMWAIDRQKHCITACFLLGWFFGTVFFFGTCWWLAYAPIHYAGFPPLFAYSLIMIVCLAAGLFPGIFALILSILLRRFGSKAFLAAPFVWVFTEFLRYWLTGNNWNAIGYSQAFEFTFFYAAAIGGVLATGFFVVAIGSIFLFFLTAPLINKRLTSWLLALGSTGFVLVVSMFGSGDYSPPLKTLFPPKGNSKVVAVQPNIPMDGLDAQKWHQLRDRQITTAINEVSKIRFPRSRYKPDEPMPIDLPEVVDVSFLVILPESPMNFAYNDDREFQIFINAFARKNNVGVLFNSSEPDPTNAKYFNSAVMVGPEGNKIAEYDKIFLLPFGEAVPVPFDTVMPAFVGSFSYGSNYALLPVGDAKAGVMICFESHFGQLSREYVKNGADVIIEMTNDGYLGPTPVLRQHLANAVFRAVETNRPVLRVTNVGITAYIDEKGRVLFPTERYQEDTRVWGVSKSDGSQTFYVKYGDWFAWLCSVVTIFLIILSCRKQKAETRAVASVP